MKIRKLYWNNRNELVMGIDGDFLELAELIDGIQSMYESVNARWSLVCNERMNLKKLLVKDIVVGDPVFRMILEYASFLNDVLPPYVIKLSRMCACVVTARVKTQNSIEYKLQAYCGEKHAMGNIPVTKCMNDLFGIRMVLSRNVPFDSIIHFLNDAYDSRYRYTDASKDEYRAVHLYFRDGSFSFPWELQIWNPSDRSSNIDSHKKYKQGYTSWEQERMKGGILDV